MKFTRIYNLDDQATNTTLPLGSFKKGESVEFDLTELKARGINVNSEEEFDRHYGFAFKPKVAAKKDKE